MLAIPSSEFVSLLKWRLGIPFLPVNSSGSPCGLCGRPLDEWGEHFVKCVKSKFWKRHNIWRNVCVVQLWRQGWVLSERW